MKKIFITITLIATYSLTNAQIISTFAGNGTAGYLGNGVQATAAELWNPTGVAVDARGNLYIADADNNRIRTVSTAGIISTIAGNGTAGYGGDGGQATAAELRVPYGVAFDATDNLYIADEQNNVIRKVTTAGIITTVAGNGTAGYGGDGGQATAAALYYPTGVAVDARGNLYIADADNNRIRTISTAGIISTFAGTGTGGYTGDGGQATSAKLHYPSGVSVDASGNVYIADQSNSRIRKVNPAGIISTIAGNGTNGYSGDGGQATAAGFRGPSGVSVDASGNVYIADYINSVIRTVNTAGIINTFAGRDSSGIGIAGYTGDGGAATAAELYFPQGVATDATGNIYIADASNNRIRKVCVSICAGAGISQYSNLNTNFSVYPNPSNSVINVVADFSPSFEMTICDVLGNVLISSPLGRSGGAIDVSGLSNGVYFVRVGTATQKFIKQ